MKKMMRLAFVPGESVVACASAKAVDVLNFLGRQNQEEILRKTRFLLKLSVALAGLLSLTPSAKAADVIDTVYGNSAGGGPDIVGSWNVNITAGTATLNRSYNVSSGNGRAVVVLGDTIYSTQVGDNHIYETSVTTGLPTGSITTSLAPGQGMATLAWDGTQFWTSDYNGGNQAYRINLAGTVTQTITLGTGDNKDGLEYFNGMLIANRGDAQAPYDVYSTSGTLLTAALISPSTASTGIAFDGTYFLTSDIFNSALDVWDSSGAFVKSISLPSDGSADGNLIEDLSVNYNTTTNAPDGGSTLVLLSMASVLCGVLKRRFGRV